MKSQRKNHKKFFDSFKWAFLGIKSCFLKERNFRFHIFMTALVLLFSFIFKIKLSHFIILLICISTVLIFELINTLVEEICDIICSEYNEKIKYIKDLSAGVVLISAITAAVIGLIIFVPYLVSYI